jgi:hypothetical protein
MTDAEVTAEIEHFGNAQEREGACLALAADGGENVLPALRARLKNAAPANEFQRQAYAAQALSLMGTAASAAVEDMVNLLAGEQIHNGTRYHIVKALGAIAPGTDAADAALAALRTQTTHPNRTVRRWASNSIEQFFEGE